MPLPGRTWPRCLVTQLTGRNRPPPSHGCLPPCTHGVLGLASGTGLLQAFPTALHGNALSSTGKLGSDKAKAMWLNRIQSRRVENWPTFEGTQNSHVETDAGGGMQVSLTRHLIKIND